MRQRTLHRRRASVYLMTLGCALVVALIGVSAIMVVRARQRWVQDSRNYLQARYCAQSAIDMGLRVMKAQTNWRSTFSNGVWFSNATLGNGRMALWGIDTTDGNLADSPLDPVDLIGVGTCGDAVYNLRVTLVPPNQPLAALNTCIHSGAYIENLWSCSLTVVGGSASANTEIDNYSTLTGNAEAPTIYNVGTITGTATTGVATKNLPDATVVDQYAALATSIPYSGSLQGVVLSPANNPYGATNTDGVYLINTNGGDIQIAGVRVRGTLIVRLGGGELQLGPSVLFEPARPDYPCLIVEGHAHLQLNSGSPLRESDWGMSFNPIGTPFQGAANNNTNEEYPNELRGLVHITSRVYVVNETRIYGMLLCNAELSNNSKLYVLLDPQLYANPPKGYTENGAPVVSPNTWRPTLTVP